MDMPLIDRNPTRAETELLRLFLSFFSNGMGWENEQNGATRIGWRQIERVISYFYSGQLHKEDKDIFDVICPAWEDASRSIGISVKSKELKGGRQFFSDSPEDTRLYMELSNSHARFWGELGTKEIKDSDFGNEDLAQTIGETVLALVARWHLEKYSRDRSIVPDRSRYLVVSYGGFEEDIQTRKCAIHTFGMDLPAANWTFATPKCLKGTCPETGRHLWDWYGKSGGQLKYYPLAEDALYQTETFKLRQAGVTDFFDLVEEQFGDQQSLLRSLSERQRQLF